MTVTEILKKHQSIMVDPADLTNPEERRQQQWERLRAAQFRMEARNRKIKDLQLQVRAMEEGWGRGLLPLSKRG